MDPDNLDSADPSAMNFGGSAVKAKAWSQIWGSGQGIGAVRDIVPAATRIDRLSREYAAAKAAICG